jgi:hypothetical protein
MKDAGEGKMPKESVGRTAASGFSVEPELASSVVAGAPSTEN